MRMLCTPTAWMALFFGFESRESEALSPIRLFEAFFICCQTLIFVAIIRQALVSPVFGITLGYSPPSKTN